MKDNKKHSAGKQGDHEVHAESTKSMNSLGQKNSQHASGFGPKGASSAGSRTANNNAFQGSSSKGPTKTHQMPANKTQQMPASCGYNSNPYVKSAYAGDSFQHTKQHAERGYHASNFAHGEKGGIPLSGVAGGSAAAMKKPSHKKVIIAVAIVVAVLACTYGIGVAYFSSHFFPNTVLNDEDLSLQSSDALANQIQNQADNYSLTIEGEGFNYTFAAGETDISIDPRKIADDTTKAQDVAAWPIELFKQHDISDVVVAAYDETGISDVLKDKVNSFNESQTPSKNAQIVYDADNDSFTLKPEVYGTQLNADAVIKKAGDAMKTMRADCKLTDDDLIKPEILAADPRSLSALKKTQELFPNNVELTLNGSVNAATIDKATFANWVYIDPGDFSPKIDQDTLTGWVDEQTSGMNTVGTSRTWTREDGKQCSVSGGTYGWKVDTSSLAQTVYDTLSQGGATSIDIPCSQTGAVYNGPGQRDWGAYVDVDLTEQTARYYDASGNLLHSCGVVSGLPTKDRATPTGVYYLNNKQSPSKLIGYKPNGQIDYETPVQYWMPFVGNSVGLHDATWQSSFGGTCYQTNGSHGCVNLSLGDAQWFYDNLQVGVCIITHN